MDAGEDLNDAREIVLVLVLDLLGLGQAGVKLNYR
jgi:hypothetical protein